MLDATARHGLEGLVAKRVDSIYRPGARSSAWVKHKHRRRDTFAIVTRGSPPERDTPSALPRRGAWKAAGSSWREASRSG